MESLLAEADIESSTRFDLFDALDADLSGELTFSEVIEGLMRLRGPISKSDIIAVRLKVRHITQLMEDSKIGGVASMVNRPITNGVCFSLSQSVGDRLAVPLPLNLRDRVVSQLPDTTVATTEDQRW